MAILLKTASVWVSYIQIMQVRVQNKGKSVWKSRHDGDVSGAGLYFWRFIIDKAHQDVELDKVDALFTGLIHDMSAMYQHFQTLLPLFWTITCMI